MPKKKTKQSLLLKLKQDMKGAKPLQHIQKATAPALSKWYQDITILPLNRFIEVSVNGNLSALIIEGSPAAEDLFKTWTDIQEQYADVVADNEMKMVIKLQARHAELLTRMQMFDFLLEHMRKYYCDQFCKEMNALLKTNFKFDPANRTEYYALLDRCYNRSKGFVMEFKVNEIKLDGLLKKRAGSQPTRQYYQGMLIALSDFAKYVITDTITVWEYCERMRLYHLHEEALRREIDKQRKK